MAWLTRGVALNLGFSAAAFALFAVTNRGYAVSLRDVQYFNGWVLAGCIFVMLLLTIRKRLVILPLGRVRRWLQLHYYLGFATIGVFLVHTRYRLPDSPPEWLLWGLFVGVAVSGVIGGLLSKRIPPQLEARGERILFERIPVFRAQLADEAEALALTSVKAGDAVSLTQLYKRSLAEYFARPRNILAHLQGSTVPLTRILGELDSIERYLDETEKHRLATMRDLVVAKNNLDFHHANGGLLKLWLFFHIPPTYALIIAIVVHVLAGYAFSTGIA
ncbi:hypothetical protein [Breoghania sp. L-A4]|uniref:hypothetical protein n=1 Tax=Breoghania sp. L-A4 TaxID=2304600 RepID=UPI000E35D199|nr:hypothetical protein [Breoghania sp. L-A4]AXS41667.1 hypothetical protein D1F64_18765 [Breoghania sp. L-A4]